MDEMELSFYGAASVEPSPVSRMMASFAADFRDGVDINLGVGYVNEKTIPRGLILEGMQKVIADPQKYRGALNYGGPQGSENLIQSIKKFILDNRIGSLSEYELERHEILIAPSGATSLLEGLAQLLPRGLVITSDPIYYIYSNFLERMGFEILAIPEDDEGLDTDLLAQTLSEIGNDQQNIRFIYVVTINNPTGTILSNRRRRKLVEMAAQLSHQLGRKVPLVLDRAYEDLIHDPAVPRPDSALLYDEAGLVYELSTLSKIFAPALRIGYMIGPPGDFTRAMIQRTSDVGFSAPLIMQEIAGYILEMYAIGQLTRVNRGYRQKALDTGAWIDETLGEFISQRHGGQAGFYYYLTFDTIETHDESDFFRFLTRTTGKPEIDGPPDNKHPRVLTIPGRYCVHAAGSLMQIGQRQLRLSYGFEEPDNIHKALQLMREAVEYCRSL
ncbi:MAG: PLP-dependent aminotransferase family protein [Sedimentisphaerales bacterium]|nr:PLP-dependent aminotransferase family protein [Sedimentisphaerales bacterium]